MYFQESLEVVSVRIGNNPAKLASVIRFHLGELGARNAHHEFEHLARHIARARIASNILPATGPVSSGGDGGRDFETFETRQVTPGPPGNAFAQRSSGGHKIIFACSLEKKKIEAKIRSDVIDLIKAGGADEVIYFCESNLPIGKRLKLVEEAKGKGMPLQIFDGAAIAEMLADPDIYWIAQEYLHLPSEYLPARELGEDYLAHKREWEARAPVPLSRADFSSIKAGLRKATFDESARPDLNFWLGKIAVFLESPAPREMSRDAMYEIAVANLRGKGDLTPVDGLVSDYFSDVAQHVSIGQITDAAVLVTYCCGAAVLHQYQVDEDVLVERRGAIAGLLADNLAQADIGPGRRSGLLRTKGYLALTEQKPRARTVPDQALKIWHEMLDVATDAPLFPVEEFSDFLGTLVSQTGDSPDLLALAARVDELVGARAGNAAVGEKVIDRAFALLERGDTTAAIREFQKAKTQWFSFENLENMLRILLVLSEQHRCLGLAYAAKYHAMAAAFIARYESQDIGEMAPQALLDLLDAEDAAGNSLGFIALFPVALSEHIENDPRPLDTFRNSRIQENISQIALLLGFLKRGSQHARQCVDEILDFWPPKIWDPIRGAADDPGGFWNKENWGEVWAQFETALLDRPFGDLGLTRRVQWSALGIEWVCEFNNDYETTPHAEQLIAELQLAACALSDRDLGIVPASVTINVAVDADASNLHFELSEDISQVVNVKMPTANQHPTESFDSIMLVAAILHSCSTLDEDALRDMFNRSVVESTFVARPYSELFQEFVPEDAFHGDVRKRAGAFEPGRMFQPKLDQVVSWYDGPGPTYSEQAAHLDIANRYGKTQAMLRHTLPRLLNDPEAMARVREMHDRGLKDWEILGILSNVALRIKLSREGIENEEGMRERALVLYEEEETESEAVNPAEFTEDALATFSRMYHAAFLNGQKLRYPKWASAAGLEQFLVARYRMREDDIEHPDIFNWDTAD